MKYLAFCASILMILTCAFAEDGDLSSLDHWLKIHNVPDEKNSGHIWPGDKKAKCFEAIIKNHPNIQTVVETGFCFGHSAEVFLKTRADISVLSFDLMTHWYCYTGKDYLSEKYPDRHSLIVGDSRKTVPKFSRENEGKKFDLILVDGGHDYDVALADIINMQSFAKPDSILIVDDTNFGPVNDAWEKCKEDGIVEELERYTDYAMGWLIGRYITN